MANKNSLPGDQNGFPADQRVKGERLGSGTSFSDRPKALAEDTDGFEEQPETSASLEPLGEDVIDTLQRSLPNPRPKRQELFLPVHGFVWFHNEEIEIINHPAFQRLDGLHQLGQAHLVYRGATHRRLEHSLGTVHVAQRMISAVNENCTVLTSPEHDDQWHVGCPLSRHETRFIRLAALLHDIGHIPFGHTFEDELNLLNKHDGRERIEKIFRKTEWYGEPTQSLESLIDNLYKQFVPPGLSDKPSELIKRILLHEPLDLLLEKEQEALHLKQQQSTGPKPSQTTDERLAERGFRIAVCGDMVGNTICADLLDYIYRDWYHIGSSKPVAERIFQYMSIRIPAADWKEGPKGFPLPTDKDRFVVSLGNDSNFRSDGVTAIINLLESRYELAEAVIFHRTKMTATAMLERALTLSLPSGVTSHAEGSVSFRAQLEDWLIDHAEEELLPALREGRELFNGAALSTSEKPGLEAAQRIASRLLRRDLYHRLDTFTAAHDPKYVKKIQNLYGDNKASTANREAALRRLEDDYNLPRGSVAMYCPDSRMNSKIAKVRVFVEGEVYRIDQYEEDRKTEKALSRGHLTAQLKRFDDLWRIVFFVDPDVYKSRSASFWSLVKEAIYELVLGIIRRGDTYALRAARLAREAVTNTDMKHIYSKKALEEPKRTFARGDASAQTETYPTGAPSILEFVE